MSLSISQRHQIVSVRTAVSVDSRTTRTQNHVSCARLASSARLGCHRRSQKLLRAAHVVQVSSKIQQGKQHAFSAQSANFGIAGPPRCLKRLLAAPAIRQALAHSRTSLVKHRASRKRHAHPGLERQSMVAWQLIDRVRHARLSQRLTFRVMREDRTRRLMTTNLVRH